MTADAAAPVLVTGASGFLGAWTIARLLADGETVVACDIAGDTRRLDGVMPPAERPPGLAWRRLDVTDAAAVDAAVAEAAPRAVVHMAALQIPACRESPGLGAAVNVGGQANVLEAAARHGVARVVYTSSIAAKPREPDNAPGTFYGVYKRAGEEIARMFWLDRGLPSIGLRPYVVYGVGRDQGETSAITAAIRAAALGERYRMPFGGRSAMQYAGEVADIFARCTRATPDGALVSDLSTEVQDVDEVIAAIRAVVPDAAIEPAGEARVTPDSGFDDTPLRRLIGDWPRVPLADGVAATIAHFRRLARDQSF